MIPSIAILIPHIRNPFFRIIIENSISKFSKKDTIKNIKKTGVFLKLDLEFEDHLIL